MTNSEVPPAFAGIPNEMLPMWPYWRLPGGRIEAVSDPAALSEYTLDSALLRPSSESNRLIAEHLGQLHGLRYLALDGRVVPESVLEAVSALSGLERLHLTRVPVSNLAFLTGLTQLNYLCIEGLPKADDISGLSKLPVLTSLSIGINLPYLDVFGTFPTNTLQCLILQGSSESRPAKFNSLEPLAALSGLRYLCLLGCRTADRSLAVCGALRNLETVVVWKESHWNAGDIAAIRAAGIQFTSLT